MILSYSATLHCRMLTADPASVDARNRNIASGLVPRAGPGGILPAGNYCIVACSDWHTQISMCGSPLSVAVSRAGKST